MIRIGLIDSGVDMNCSAIRSAKIQNGLLLAGDDFGDRIGHGTACAYLIQNKVPDSVIYVVKVFDKQLQTSVSNLIKGIKWCIKRKVKIINISVSTTNSACYYELFDACKEAAKNDIIIVASANNMGRLAFPACMGDVIGVGTAMNISSNDFYYVRNSSVQYYTIGKLDKENSICFSQKTLSSTSFATANMSGIIANIIEGNYKLSLKELRELLFIKASKCNFSNLELLHNDFKLEKLTEPICCDNSLLKYISKMKKICLLVSNKIDINIYERYANLLCVAVNTGDDFNVDAIVIKSSERKDPRIDGIDNIFMDKKLRVNIIGCNVLTPQLNLINVAKIARKVHPNHIYKNQIPVFSLINIGHYPCIFDIELSIRETLFENNILISHVGSYQFSEFFKCDFSMPYFDDLMDLSIDELFKLPKILIETINNMNKSKGIMFGINYKIDDINEMQFIHNVLLNSIQSDIICFVINDMDSYAEIETKVDVLTNSNQNVPFCFIKNNISSEMIDLNTSYGLSAQKSIEHYRENFDKSIKKQLELKYKTKVYDFEKEVSESLFYDYIRKLF